MFYVQRDRNKYWPTLFRSILGMTGSIHRILCNVDLAEKQQVQCDLAKFKDTKCFTSPWRNINCHFMPSCTLPTFGKKHATSYPTKESTLTHLPLSTLLTGVDGRIEAYPWLKPPDTITRVTNWSPFSTRKSKNDMINFMYMYIWIVYLVSYLNTITMDCFFWSFALMPKSG